MNGAAVQQALYTRLTSVPAVSSAVQGIYAVVPQPDDAGLASDFPYITIGNDNATPMDTKGSDGSNTLCQIDVWSRAGNYIEAKNIGQAVYDALQKFDLVVAGANTIDCRFESSQTIDDPDGETKRLLMLFRITLDDI